MVAVVVVVAVVCVATVALVVLVVTDELVVSRQVWQVDRQCTRAIDANG